MAKKKEAEQSPEPLGPSFEVRLARLQAIVNALESGDSPLEESVALYREGLGHSSACRQQLASARHELEVFSDGQGAPLSNSSQSAMPPLRRDNDDEGAWL